ncbi:MAG: sigma-70 family RNA polymerase sigma factor [Gemmataceae bacterium]|nr:sigma-70 family RNA polymerase sigma factor [Gemmataceae bacterium]MCI0738023.1 sigma-70 family RNA polymerase sigma factor [Gemmataceae bacterium]
MAKPMPAPLLQWIRHVADDPFTGCSDQELLRRFIVSADESTFSALVRRHGAMVFDVCRAMLPNESDAEDVFQATFLVLAAKAKSIRKTASLGSWLYGVAYRTAQKAQAAYASRRKHEAQLPKRDVSISEELSWLEVQRILHEELNGLSERYRAPLVACYLQGRAQDDAATLLGLTKGTLKRRLERGRALLRARLVRRGVGLAGVLVASAWPAVIATAAAPSGLVHSTVKAGVLTATGQVATSVVSANVANLTEGALRTMIFTKTKALAVIAFALIVLGLGGGMFFRQSHGAEEDPRVAQQVEKAETAQPDADAMGDPLPPGALARLGTMRFRHENPYLHLLPAFSPNGKVLATGGNNEIRLWETASGKLLREIQDGYGYSELIFAADGSWLAGREAGRDPKPVRLWDPATGRRLLEIHADGRVRASSPDGKQLVVAADDGTVSLWDTATGKRTALLRGGHKKQVFGVAFTNDGEHLVTVCSSRACHWAIAVGDLLKAVELPIPNRVRALCLSPDGHSLAVCPRDQTPVYLLDTSTGKERLKLQGESSHGGVGLAFSPDGKTLASSQVDLMKWDDETTVALWDAGTGKLRRRFSMPARAARFLCFSPDSRTLLTVGGEPLVHLWDVATGKPAHHWPAHEGAITSLAFVPDGRSLVSGGLDGTVRLWDVQSGQHLRDLAGHRWGASAVAVAPDGKAVLSGGTDGCIRFQGLDGQSICRILLGKAPEKLDEPEAVVYALGMALDGKTAVSYSLVRNPARPSYHVWELASGKELSSRPDRSNVIGTRVFSPDARITLEYSYPGGGDGSGADKDAGGAAGPTLALLHETATGKQIASLSLPDPAGHAQAFALDGRTLLTATYQSERKSDGWHYENGLRLWELATAKARMTIPSRSRGRFVQVAAAPNGRAAATVSDDGALHVWDLVTGKELLRRAGLGSTSCLAFAPDAKTVASGHMDGTILIWDLSTIQDKGEPDRALDKQLLEQWWTELGTANAPKAHAAIWALIQARDHAVALLRERLSQRKVVPAEELQRLIADLDSAEFQRRTAATKQLTAFGESAEQALRDALNGQPTVEQRRRIEMLLQAVSQHPDLLRHVRSVEILEQIGTVNARRVLNALAKGAFQARLTREAVASLSRLAGRSAGASNR